jgi:hypothetical protein
VPDFGTIESGAMQNAIESSNAGGLRSAELGLGIEEMNNGITDRSYDTVPDSGPAVSGIRLHVLVKSSSRLPEAVNEPGKPLTN